MEAKHLNQRKTKTNALKIAKIETIFKIRDSYKFYYY